MTKKKWKKTRIAYLRNRWFLLLFKNSKSIRLKLKYFIQTNNLYSVEEFKISKLLAGANQKVNKVSLSSIIFFRKEEDEEFKDVFLNIKIKKMGSDFDSKIQNTFEQVQALFGEIQIKENNWDHYYIQILTKKGDEKVVYLEKNMFNFLKRKKNNGKIKFGKRIEVIYKNNPGILLVGNSGSGKSYFLYSLLPELAKEGDLFVIDAKFNDLEIVASKLLDCDDRCLHPQGGGVAHSIDDSIAIIEMIHGEMIRRNEAKEKDSVPIFLMIDEYLIFNSRLENERGDIQDKNILEKLGRKKKISTSEYIERLLIDISLLGRSVGVTLVIALQRLGSSSNGLNLRLKDNLSTKIGLGNLSPVNFEMLFGQKKGPEIISRGQGQGYINYRGEIELFEANRVKFAEDFFENKKDKDNDKPLHHFGAEAKKEKDEEE